MKKRNEKYEQTLLRLPLDTFLTAYNVLAPNGFPRATARKLQEFQIAFPSLFKHGDSWSIAQHRKRLIDWLSAGRPAV